MSMAREQYKKKFEEFNKNNDGKLTLAELHQHIEEMLKTEISDAAVKFLFDSMDTSKKGFITKEEWMDTLDKKSLDDIEQDDLKRTFQAIDKSGDGFLSKDEMFEVMKSKNRCPTEEQFDKMMETYDTNKDGKIDFLEFIAAVYKDK